MNEAASPAALARLAGALAADGVTAEVIDAWRDAGFDGVLIKGPTIADWLYGDELVRGYGDSDLLVSPRDQEAAARVLQDLGFREQPYPDPDTSKHATPWVRDTDGAVVDLHHRLWGAWGPTAQQQWDALLSAWTEHATVGGRPVLVPTPPARLMLIALHASQHRDLEGKPLEDLRRALMIGQVDEWRRASLLADALGAAREMAGGLRRLPMGAELFGQLPILGATLLDEPERSQALTRLRRSEARETRGTLTLIGDAVQLRPADLRRRYPVARGGRAGMTLAGAMRVGHLLRRTPDVLRRALRAPVMLSAYGLNVRLLLAIPELGDIETPAQPDAPQVTVSLADRDELEELWSGPRAPRVHASAVIDGSAWSVETGLAGDLRMTHPLAGLHLDATGTILRCAPTNQDEPAWRRLLLDTGLVTVSLARGFDALHASAVTLGEVAVAVAGPAGAGKTTLMAALLDRGARLLADDVLALGQTPDGSVIAHPGPPLANLPAETLADSIGHVVHHFGDEQWVRVERPAAGPAELYLVVILERREDAGEPIFRSVPEPAAALLAHALHTGASPQRRRARFELLADVAASAHVMALTAGPGVPADMLADVVRARVPTAGVS